MQTSLSHSSTALQFRVHVRLKVPGPEKQLLLWGSISSPLYSVCYPRKFITWSSSVEENLKYSSVSCIRLVLALSAYVDEKLLAALWTHFSMPHVEPKLQLQSSRIRIHRSSSWVGGVLLWAAQHFHRGSGASSDNFWLQCFYLILPERAVFNDYS